MSKRNDSYICLATSTTMSDADLKVFKSMRNIRGLGAMIVKILTAYAHEKGFDEVDIYVLNGYATVYEAEQTKKGCD